MTTIATKFSIGATRVQIGTAACAIAIAAAIPTVASAEPVAPAPLAPLTQVLSSGPILGPIDFAQDNFGWWFFPSPGNNNPSPVAINSFSPLIFGVVGAFIFPLVAIFRAVVHFVARFFHLGPYGTGQNS